MPPTSSPFMSPAASAANLASSSMASWSLPAPRPHGVRAHLADILPITRHAVFSARVTIHQLWNVPLVSGQFAVRWKFSNAQRIRMSRTQSYVSERSMIGTAGAATNGNGVGDRGKGKQKADEGPADSSVSAASSSSGDLPFATETGEGYSQEARGRTPYEPLIDHNVVWDQTVNVPVSMAIQRDTMELQPCEMKLVVEQLVVSGDPNAPRSPRLGELTLNLAEYVGEGAIGRRYLLRNSKTNATLQLTIALTQIGGETSYKKPPLQKSEVHAGVAKLLQHDSHIAVGSMAYLGASASRPTLNGSRTRASSFRSDADGVFPELIGSGQRTADNIVEAIFNPVPTTSKAPSPFTYYTLPRPRPPTPDPGDDASVDGHAPLYPGRPPSIALSVESEATTASRSSAGTGPREGRARWWHRLATSKRNVSAQTPAFTTGSLPSSVRSSPINPHMDSLNAPQIIVRRPSSNSPAPHSRTRPRPS